MYIENGIVYYGGRAILQSSGWHHKGTCLVSLLHCTTRYIIKIYLNTFRLKLINFFILQDNFLDCQKMRRYVQMYLRACMNKKINEQPHATEFKKGNS